MPELVFRHVDDIPWQEGRAQQHGDRRVSVWNRLVEWGEDGPSFVHTRYDPGLTLEVHGHNSNHIIYILKGSVTISEVECTPGMMILLEHGATFGPIVAGPEGTELVEFYSGDPRPRSADPEGYLALLASKNIELLPHPKIEIPSRRSPATD
jgi:hypothetical protein